MEKQTKSQSAGYLPLSKEYHACYGRCFINSLLSPPEPKTPIEYLTLDILECLKNNALNLSTRISIDVAPAVMRLEKNINMKPYVLLEKMQSYNMLYFSPHLKNVPCLYYLGENLFNVDMKEYTLANLSSSRYYFITLTEKGYNRIRRIISHNHRI